MRIVAAPGLVTEVIELDGAVAQLGEHLLCKQGVSGSIPLSSTKVLVLRTERSKRSFASAERVANPGFLPLAKYPRWRPSGAPSARERKKSLSWKK